ncbi:Gene 25-like lysozyme [Chitinophaga jiangningensis]|uniref:Gene 25-like lysozyme n=1 Tax=Chitinophaga jiangningensis TaxID=1419482 RepID=A0A1M7CV50_9BACT|nr:GPW/gp25 family protein [Chitinophaga jiangningensis]SHL70699.1 Gene 25-like lysozyme [Chitinophaga jiangningensis]
MHNKYLQIPLQLNELLQGHRQPRIHIKESIRQHIWLLVNTYQGEHQYAPDYGFPLWEQSIRINPTEQMLKSHIEQSFQEYLSLFESRIKQTKISVSFDHENSIAIGLIGCTIFCNQEFVIDYQLLIHPLLYK